MTEFFKYFAAYVINLPERVDRLGAANEEFARIGAKIGRDIKLYPAQKHIDRRGFPSAGVRGCFYSHWDCLRQAHGEGKPVLILEDDVSFSPAFSRLIPQLMAIVQSSNWDFIYFGHEETGDFGKATSNTKRVWLAPWKSDLLTAHFYCVNTKTLPRLLAHLDRVANGVEGDDEFGPMPVDGAFNVFRRLNPDVLTLLADPKLGWQRPSRSDLTPKIFDSWTTLRPLVAALRELKYRGSRWRL